MRFRTSKKYRVMYPLDTSFFRKLDGGDLQRMLRTSANRVCWN